MLRSSTRGTTEKCNYPTVECRAAVGGTSETKTKWSMRRLSVRRSAAFSRTQPFGCSRASSTYRRLRGLASWPMRASICLPLCHDLSMKRELYE